MSHEPHPCLIPQPKGTYWSHSHPAMPVSPLHITSWSQLRLRVRAKARVAWAKARAMDQMMHTEGGICHVYIAWAKARAMDQMMLTEGGVGICHVYIAWAKARAMDQHDT